MTGDRYTSAWPDGAGGAAGAATGRVAAVGRPTRARRRRVGATLLAGTLAVVAVWGVNLWQVRVSVAEYAQWWDQPRGEPGGLLYVALGDSAAQGIGASRPDRGYVGLIAQRLRETTGRPVQVVNLSRSGARVRDVVDDQLPRLAALRPDLVTVGVGGNDIRGYDADRYERDVTALVDGLPAGAVIADTPYFMHGAAQRDADRAAAAVTHLAEQRGLVVAPLQEAMRRRGWRAMLTDYAADWFHPNDRGHRVLASTFWDAIGSRLVSGSPAAGVDHAAGRAAE